MISPRDARPSLADRSFGLGALILVILVAASSIVYWQGRTVLVADIESRVASDSGHRRALFEQALAEVVARVESLSTQPVMARILDDDEDHEIAELLDVVVAGSRRIAELTCFDSDGKTVASTNPSRFDRNAEVGIERVPAGKRYRLSNQAGEERLIVPIVLQFDEAERIGRLMAVIDRHVLLGELNAWWAGLISESGEVLVHGGQQLIEDVPASADQFTHPDLGVARITHMPVTMPKGGVADSWVLADATPDGERYQSVRVLGLMIALTTLFSSALVLAVVRHFSRKQQGLLIDLSDQCQRLEEATLEIAGQKEEAEAMNAELTSVNDSLEEARVASAMATKAKSEFLANMSHEIRTPMTAILGFSENLRDGDLSKQDASDAIETIQKNGEYLLGLINDILDMSKVEAGKMEVEHIPCSPQRIVAETVSLMQIRSQAKDLALGVEFIGSIPETIHSDPTRLKQILINLVGNAIKFTEEGGVRLITRFVPDEAGPLLQFDIVDTGVGMTETQANNLFRPFTQADGTMARKFGGTGLGLAISQGFAQMLGGEVTVVDTKPGCGTRFRTTIATGSLRGIRMVDPTTALLNPEPAPPAKTSSTEKPLDCRILLAEDGPDNQRLISFILKKAGAEVTVAEDGQVAVDAALAARASGKPFDMILMDMQMPVLDGCNATMALRDNDYTGPIIALTAHAMESDRQKCIKAGCDDFATKPIDRQKLIETIQAHLHVATV